LGRIYLTGFMGVGKTTLGKKLAHRLGCVFVDLDDFFEETYKIDIHLFFEKYNEPLFRQLEHERLIKTFEMQDVVVATGGGTPCHKEGIKEINRHGTSVFLDMPPAMIADRLIHAKRKRPLILGKSGEELTRYIETKLNERMDCYRQSNLHIDASNLDMDDLEKQVRDYLVSH